MFATLTSHLAPLDIVLVAVLCLVLPVVQWRGSLRGAKKKSRPPLARYLLSIAMLGGPLALLALDWRLTGRSADTLGLAIPVPFGGEIGFAVAGVLFVGALAASLWSRLRPNPEKEAAQRAQMDDAGMISKTPVELCLFVVVTFVIGCGAEILFRGFLLWAFAPLTGVAGAVVLAALAYGIGHGFKSWKQALGSVVSAFAFTIAYALTHSLWWLMLIHTALPLSMGLSGYRRATRKAIETATSHNVSG